MFDQQSYQNIMSLPKLALLSISNFFILIISSKLHLKKHHLSKKYKAIDGKIYQVFRETVSQKEYSKQEITLTIGFRLKVIDQNPLFHYLFQRLSLFNTPLWVGFPGFKTKFWMVEPKTKNYLGLYRYQGKENAIVYAKYITAILKPISTKNSVWYKIQELDFKKYINNHRYNTAHKKS